MNNDSKVINIIGFILITMAGWVDAVGVSLFLNESASFMTGRGFALGYWAFNLDFKVLMSIGIVVISFIMGACFSTIVTRKKGLIGGLLLTGGLIILASLPISLNHLTMNAILVPMAMGCQNGATSLTPIDRTTHLTGAATDIGINIAKGNWRTAMFWILRWLGFPLGCIIGLNFVNMVNNNLINISIALIIPAMIIIGVGIIQKIFFNIPLLDETILTK